MFAHLAEQVNGGSAPDGDGREVCVEFRMPTRAEVLADQVKGLRDEGLRMRDIAAKLGCHRNLVKKALDHWYTRRGQTPPDGRSVRSSLRREGETAPRFQRIATQVKALADQGLLLQKIAERLACERNDVTKALRFACEQAGEPCVDGRTRRRSLARKTSGPCRRRSA